MIHASILAPNTHVKSKANATEWVSENGFKHEAK
jgi:hypothetical protein